MEAKPKDNLFCHIWGQFYIHYLNHNLPHPHHISKIHHMTCSKRQHLHNLEKTDNWSEIRSVTNKAVNIYILITDIAILLNLTLLRECFNFKSKNLSLFVCMFGPWIIRMKMQIKWVSTRWIWSDATKKVTFTHFSIVPMPFISANTFSY